MKTYKPIRMQQCSGVCSAARQLSSSVPALIAYCILSVLFTYYILIIIIYNLSNNNNNSCDFVLWNSIT